MRHSIASSSSFACSLAFTLLPMLWLAGCALPGSGDGSSFGNGKDEESDSSDSSGGHVLVPTFPGPGGSTSPTFTAGTSGAAGSGSFGSPPGAAGTTAVPPTRASAWPGFTLLPGLGASCPITAADDPLMQYGSLETKPCTNGATGCSELVWNGLTPAGMEIGVDPLWDLDVVGDDQGAPSHLIVTRHYGLATEGSEIVIYDLADGNAVAGFRNGAPDVIASFLPALQSSCKVAMVGSRGRVWLVVSEAGVTRVASADLAELGADLEPSAIDVDATVIDGTMLGGPDRLALEAEDGQLYLVTTALDVIATYGPDVRVWLSSLAPGGVLVRSQDTATLAESYFLMDGAGSFTQVLKNVEAAGSDGVSLAWFERDVDQSMLRVASASADSGFDVMGAPSTPVVRLSNGGMTSAPVTFSPLREVQLMDGRAVVSGSANGTFSDSAFIVGSDGALQGEAPLGSALGAKSPILALQGDFLWLGVGYEDHGAFPTLQRLEL